MNNDFLALKAEEFGARATRTLWNNPGEGNYFKINQTQRGCDEPEVSPLFLTGIITPQKAPETLKHSDYST